MRPAIQSTPRRMSLQRKTIQAFQQRLRAGGTNMFKPGLTNLILAHIFVPSMRIIDEETLYQLIRQPCLDLYRWHTPCSAASLCCKSVLLVGYRSYPFDFCLC